MLGVWRLQPLREISRRGSVKSAAEAMDITPSAVSQQLATLEREAGVQLLERSGRRVRLTDAGVRLVRHADTITGAIAAAEADLADLSRGSRGARSIVYAGLRGESARLRRQPMKTTTLLVDPGG